MTDANGGTVYRYIGTGSNGHPAYGNAPDAETAVRRAAEENAKAAVSGAPQDWRAEVAVFEWKRVES